MGQLFERRQAWDDGLQHALLEMLNLIQVLKLIVYLVETQWGVDISYKSGCWQILNFVPSIRIKNMKMDLDALRGSLLCVLRVVHTALHGALYERHSYQQ